ncbi:MAG: LysM peptidoglycan-binding domain-containing protein [Chloroflexi bacterium]|nr:LysM peptidoglycan-binding domain-containing protein [Chloroflexota bacterium]
MSSHQKNLKSLFGSAVAAMAILLAIFVSVGDPMPGVRAQDGSPTPIPSTNTVHVVQRGETLYGIAAQYGSSVEAIMTVNGITDARFIAVGQRLLIPGAQAGTTASTAVTHIVEPGETLYAVAERYHTTVDAVAMLNNVTHPRRLYAGQRLSLGDRTPSGETFARYEVQPGDTLLRIAVQFAIPVTRIAAVNNLLPQSPVWPGQNLRIPEQPPNGAWLDIQAPLVALSISPVNPIQGQSIGLRFESDRPVEATGSFMGRTFQPLMIEEGRYGAVLGVHAFTVPGVYPIHLQLVAADGRIHWYDVRIRVDDGGYGSEAINIPEDRQYLLAGEVVQTELERVITIMAGFNTTRYFDGLMALPASGPVTSQFGTRRSYNGSPYNTFHAGTDFGGAVGAPLTAPADGVVMLAETLQVRGNTVILDHGWGVYTGYWHQSEIYVEVGQQVSKGDVIGALGGTGLVTGPHLHWEMWVQGVQVDPMQWVQQTFP